MMAAGEGWKLHGRDAATVAEASVKHLKLLVIVVIMLVIFVQQLDARLVGEERRRMKEGKIKQLCTNTLTVPS